MMKQWQSSDELLDFAIAREQEAADFYAGLAASMEREAMRDVFHEFAREEQAHKARLEKVKATGIVPATQKGLVDLKIGDYLVDVEPGPKMTYQEALILAMKKEKAAFKLYSDMAGAAEDEALRDLLLAMAREEARHKLRFEVEYDDYVYRED